MQLSAKQISHIDKTIILGDNKMIVEIDVSEDKGRGWSENEICYNIYCVGKDYNIIWQVKEIKTKPPFNGRDPFCYLGKNEKDEIIADRFSGFVYKIDPETGEAEQVSFHK
jgi:hypothetical protein